MGFVKMPGPIQVGTERIQCYEDLAQRIEYLRNLDCDQKYPSEIYLHADEEFDSLITDIKLYGADDEGPYVWFCAIKIRPPAKKEVWIW